jgi:hypothetical protein
MGRSRESKADHHPRESNELLALDELLPLSVAGCGLTGGEPQAAMEGY